MSKPSQERLRHRQTLRAGLPIRRFMPRTPAVLSDPTIETLYKRERVLPHYAAEGRGLEEAPALPEGWEATTEAMPVAEVRAAIRRNLGRIRPPQRRFGQRIREP